LSASQVASTGLKANNAVATTANNKVSLFMF
jgi:hypothetical protein